MGRASRTDVARLAGVSTAVVSYVLNNGPRPVADSTRERVLAAMKELSYRPNASARALKLAKTDVLGLLVPDLMNPFFSEFVAHLQDQAYDAGYALITGNSGREARQEAAQLSSMVDRGVEGILTFGFHEQSTMKDLLASGVPVVSLDWRIHDGAISTVAVDDYRATELALDHLVAHGYSEIGLIGGGSSEATARPVAWRDCMRNFISPERADQIVAHGEFTMAGGFDATMNLFRRETAPPAALFVSSDVQAVGTLRALSVLGIRVPHDVAVVSFDGTMASQFTTPSLTTVRFSLELMARTALQKLTSPATPERHVIIPHTLVVRESCGCNAPNPHGARSSANTAMGT